MARSIGVDPGEALVKIVELDGSYRKPRLLAVHAERLIEGQPKAVSVAAAVRNAIDDGMKGEVRLGHPCREAVLRTLELPFKGKDAIRKVVKAEVEGEIHGLSVDDMVVDFHEVGGGIDDGTRVLVAAVPKDGLRSQLSALEAVAVEPETVDVDTMALWRAADCAGAFDATADAGVEGVEPSSLTAVVDVGSRSVKVLLVEDGRLVDMRALRLGGASVVDDIAKRHGLSADLAHEAVTACSETGTDHVIEVPSELPAAGDEPADEPAPEEPHDVATRSVTVTAGEVERARTTFLQRLARELFRYLAATGKDNVRAVWVTGGASRMPGISEVLHEVFGVEPRELDMLDHVQHDLDEDEAAELGPRITAAVGLALAAFGGPAGFDMRREDLAYTKGFERVKFPLTITLMIGLLALFVYGNHRAAVLNHLELEIGRTWFDPQNKNRVSFFGMVNSVLVGRWWENPRNFLYEESRGKDYKYKELRADLIETPVHARLKLLRDKLERVAEQKQKESGIYEDVSLESGYAVLVRFSKIMQGLEPQLGRYLLTKLDLNMKGPNRTLTFNIAFRGEGFRQRRGALVAAFDAEYELPDSPFEAPKNRRQDPFKETLFRDSAETGVEGAYYTVTIRIKEQFDPFGLGANR